MKKQHLVLAVVIGLVLLGGLFVFNDKKPASPKITDTQYEDSTLVAAPSGTIDTETGEVDQTAFEENQKIGNDKSLDTLETELNSTVILKEDFSDL